MTRPFRSILAVALAAVALCAVRPALAEPQDMGPPTSRLTLEIGHGRLVRVDGLIRNLFVADTRIADVAVKSPTLIYVNAKAPGLTTITAVDRYEHVLANIEVAAVYDEAQIRADLKRLIPDADVTVSTSGGAIVLTGSARTAVDAETARTIALRYAPDPQHVVDQISVDAPSEVNLRVRIAEVSRSLIKQFGFNWAVGASHAGKANFGLSTGTGNLLPGSTSSTSATPFSPTGVATGVPTGTDNIFLGLAGANMSIELLIDALDSEGLIKILAEPNLTAISGSPASFLAGGQYPIPVPQALGVTTIDYKDYGVSLSFQATIVDNQRINLSVKPSVSEISSQGSITLNGYSVPALTVRRAQTTVELGSGQSFAIAGLMQNSINQSISRFPGLGNVPVLGALFRSDSFQRDETELVIIVTPYIVRPVSGRLATPVDGYIAPTDADRVFLGADAHAHQVGGATPATRSGAGLVGPGGFELQ